MDKKLLGQRIRNLRKLNKLTQERLAELINIDIRQVARIEAGESTPSLETLINLSKVLAVTPNDILKSFYTDDMKDIDLKSDIYDLLSLAKPEQLQLIKKLILALL